MNNLSNLVSCCGLICQTCPIYWVKQENNEDARKKMISNIIKISKKNYNIELAESDINGCKGCRGKTSGLFFLCKDCKIRACVEQKGLQYCSYCTDFPCEHLGPLYKEDPNAQVRLELIRDIL